jgi:type VI secretion system protein ImpC
MPRNSALASVEIDVAEEPREIATPEPETPFRILVAGNFSGGAGRYRRPIEIDRDNFDAVMERVGPALHLPFGSAEVALAFREIDDFHPDRLFENLAPFQALRDLRARIEDGSALPRANSQAPGAPPASGADLLRQMMGEAPAAAAAPKRSDWDQMLHDLVAPYAAPGDDPRKAEMIAQTDRAIAGEMRAVLHHAQFQSLEAAWRGLYFLTRRLETGENLRIFLLDLPQAELTSAGLRRATGDDEWGLLAGLYYFGPADEDLLKEISFVARIAGAPFISGLAPDVVGLTKAFGELRQSAYARWIGLAMPRFLLRLPYGKDASETESFAFEELFKEGELSKVPEHERYLWGHPAIGCAYLLGEAFTRFGWRMRPGAVQEIDGLPAHTYREDGDVQLKPCAEVLLTEDAAEILLDRGFMPLASIKGTDRVRLVRFQSVAEPPAPLAGRWN